MFVAGRFGRFLCGFRGVHGFCKNLLCWTVQVDVVIKRRVGFSTSRTMISCAWKSALSKRKTLNNTANFQLASDTENDNEEGVNHSDPENCICGLARVAHA